MDLLVQASTTTHNNLTTSDKDYNNYNYDNHRTSNDHKSTLQLSLQHQSFRKAIYSTELRSTNIVSAPEKQKGKHYYNKGERTVVDISPTALGLGPTAHGPGPIAHGLGPSTRARSQHLGLVPLHSGTAQAHSEQWLQRQRAGTHRACKVAALLLLRWQLRRGRVTCWSLRR